MRRDLIGPMVLAAAVLVVFLPVLGHDFVVWDDDVNVYANPGFRGLAWSDLATFWRRAYLSLYIPLTYTLWGATVLMGGRGGPDAGGLHAATFHGLNVAAHAMSVLVVYAILKALTGRRAGTDGGSGDGDEGAARRLGVSWGPFLGALLFGLHPLQVEAVAWVTGLKDVLSGLLGLLALWQFLLLSRVRHAVPEHDAEQGVGKLPVADLARGAAASACFGLALLAKPSAVAVPFLAALAVGFVNAGQGAGALRLETAGRRLAVWGLLGIWALAAVVLTVVTRRLQPQAALDFDVASLWGRLLVAGDSVGFYLYKIVWPFWLAPDYGRQPELIAADWRSVLTASALVPLLVLAWRARHRSPSSMLAAGLFVAALLPVLGFVPFRFQRYSTVADRYVYLAMLGPALLCAACLCGAGARVRRIAAAIGLAILAGLTFMQTRVWATSARLFEHGLAVNPESYELHTNLGNVLAGQGDRERALGHYRRALRIKPDNPDPHVNIGNVYRDQGQFTEAADAYFRALELKPDFPQVHYNLGLVFAARKQEEAALIHYAQALSLRPGYPEAHNNTGLILAGKGRVQDAMAHYSMALETDPRFTPAHNNLGLIYAGRGQAQDALRHYRAGLLADPTNAEVHNNLGVLLAGQGRVRESMMHYSEVLRLRPDASAAHINLANAWLHLRRMDMAMQHYSAALALNPRIPEVHHNLGLALLKAGQLEAAVEHFSTALGLNPDFAPARHSLDEAARRLNKTAP